MARLSKSKLSLLLLVCLVKDNLAFGCGMTLHVYMSEKAASLVNNENLNKLLNDETRAYRNGSVYPDSGYVHDEIEKNIKAPWRRRDQFRTYGEVSHWSDFLNAFARHIRTTCSFPFVGECRKLVAFYFGSMAHSVEDVNFDRYYVRGVANNDFKGSLDLAQNWTDTGLDFIALIEKGRFFSGSFLYVPAQDLHTVYKGINLDVTEATIRRGMQKMTMVSLGERFGVTVGYPYFKFKSVAPWGAKNYMDAKGGVYDSAQVVARMWDEAWEIMERTKLKKIPLFINVGGWPDIDISIEEEK